MSEPKLRFQLHLAALGLDFEGTRFCPTVADVIDEIQVGLASKYKWRLIARNGKIVGRWAIIERGEHIDTSPMPDHAFVFQIYLNLDWFEVEPDPHMPPVDPAIVIQHHLSEQLGAVRTAVLTGQFFGACIWHKDGKEHTVGSWFTRPKKAVSERSETQNEGENAA